MFHLTLLLKSPINMKYLRVHLFNLQSVRDNTTEIRNPQYQHTLCGKRNLKGVGFSVKGAVNEESQFGYLTH